MIINYNDTQLEITSWNIRGTFDYINPKICMIHISAIADDGAHDVFYQYDYTDSWSDEDIKIIAQEFMDSITIEGNTRRMRTSSEEAPKATSFSGRVVIKPKLSWWKRLLIFLRISK